MKHKTWFRLVLKAIGVLLLGLGTPNVIGPVVSVIGGVVTGAGWAGWGYQWFYVGEAMGGALQVAFGLYLLAGGNWIINRVIPSNRPYCPDCGYDITNARGERCPECGVMLRRANDRAVNDVERGS